MESCEMCGQPYEPPVKMAKLNKLERVFPRKVIISPGYGAGIASWAEDNGRNYDFVEDPVLIEWVENELPNLDLKDIGYFDQNEHLRHIITPIMVATGRWTAEEIGNMYLSGLMNAEVVVVNGPYRIEEYDGYESIVEAVDFEWRT